MSKIHKSVYFAGPLLLMSFCSGISGVAAQGSSIEEADESVISELVKGDGKNEPRSDEFVIRAIEVTERQRNAPLIYPLANLAVGKKVSTSSRKRIEDFLGHQLGSSHPEMRKGAVYTVGPVAGERSVPWLLLAAEDEDQGVRLAALSQLRLYAGPTDLPALEGLVKKRRIVVGVGEQDATVRFGTETLRILHQLEGGFDDPSRFDDSTFLKVVVPRAIRESAHYSDAFILRMVNALENVKGLRAQSLLGALSYIAAKKEISPESRKRITEVFAKQLDRVSKDLGED